MTPIDDALGVRVRMANPTSPEGFKETGEALALMLQDRAREVWVYVFAHDADFGGVATCISYVSGTEGPMTEFIDPRLLAMLKSAETDWN